MKVITFNIRTACADDGGNSWKFRKDIVIDYLAHSNADIVCMQEVNPAVKTELVDALSDIYAFVGEGRLVETAEYDEINLVAYKKSVFELASKEHFWLSETPDVAGSKFPTQEHWPRTCTHVVLRSSGGTYNVFATHLDNADMTARERGLELILSRACGATKAIVCGDFNETPELVEKWVGGRLVDVTDGLVGTYNEYGKASSKIDYIFVGNDVRALAPSVCDRKTKNGVYISDHFPVIAELV